MSDLSGGRRALHGRDRTGAMGRDAAESVGVRALGFLAEHPDLLQRFLALSGLDAGDLRQAAGEPSFFPSLLDFILADEPTLTRFAAHAAIDPLQVTRARGALAPAETEWPSS